MKNILCLGTLLLTFFVNSQAYSGKGDNKFYVGANFQEFATGVNVGYDHGLGENISVGLNSTYALDIPNGLEADFIDRFDIKARFNANLGSVFNLSDQFDVYPGLSLSLKNFGGHLGFRYFFSDGFGLYSEFGVAFATYSSERLTRAEEIHNQFVTNIGMIFNLN